MTSSRRFPARRRGSYQRSPNFDSDVIAEPLLAFGGRHEHVDPKTGLGPYSLAGQTRPPLRSITVGIVGPPSMISDAEQWLEACKGRLANDGSQPFLYPHFPGFNTGHPFQCELVFGNPWAESIRATDMKRALEPANFFERVQRVVDLYVGGVEVLAQRDPRPDVIVCAIPQEVVDYCTVQEGKRGEKKRIKVSRAERKARQIAGSGNCPCYPKWIRPWA